MIREEPHHPAEPVTADAYAHLPVFDDFVRLTIQHLIQLDLDGQGDCLADEVAVIRNCGPHGGRTSSSSKVLMNRHPSLHSSVGRLAPVWSRVMPYRSALPH